MRVKQNMFGEFNEAAQPKTSLAKYSIEFNDLAVPTRPHRMPFLRQTVHITVCGRSVGKLRGDRSFLKREYLFQVNS